MTSKSAKLKSHRIRQRQYAGRKKKEDVARFPGGQVKHSEREKEVKSTVIEARNRVHNLRDIPENLILTYGGYTAGRVHLDGKISEEQLKAGDAFAEAAYRYCAATGVPFPSARAQELGKVNGYSGEESESAQRRAARASNEMMTLIGVLQSCKDGPFVKQTVHNLFVMDNEAMRLMPEQQFEYLRRGLNALIWHFGLSKSLLQNQERSSNLIAG